MDNTPNTTLFWKEDVSFHGIPVTDTNSGKTTNQRTTRAANKKVGKRKGSKLFIFDSTASEEERQTYYADTYWSSKLINLRKLLTSTLQSALETVTVPKMKKSSKMFDWDMNEVVFHIATEIKSRNVAVKVWETAEPQELGIIETYISVSLSDMAFCATGLKFHFTKKGLHPCEEYVEADMLINSRDAELKVTWALEGERHRPYTCAIAQITCHLGGIDFQVRDSSHRIVGQMANTLFSSAIRESIESTLTARLHDKLTDLSDQFNAALKV